jgi:hypothetical protein
MIFRERQAEKNLQEILAVAAVFENFAAGGV